MPKSCLGHSGRTRRRMIIKVSPQGQVTIPRALRARLGDVRRMEARIEREALVLRPILADNPAAGELKWGAEGVTAEVLWQAIRILDARRAKEVAGKKGS